MLNFIADAYAHTVLIPNHQNCHPTITHQLHTLRYKLRLVCYIQSEVWYGGQHRKQNK
jgi:hypothetical protein